jgi:hypothetical protein
VSNWTDKPNPEFEQWWATKKAQGFDYGREALENVRFGFEGAQERRWQPIETAPRDAAGILAFWQAVDGSKATPNSYAVTYWESGEWHDVDDEDETYSEPTYWMPLPNPPK